MDAEKAGKKIVRLLAEDGWQAFFVGGIVRNSLLKLPSDNVDIATDATPDQIEKILSKEGIKVKPIGKKFGSILAIVDDVPVEITTFRSEGRYSDNRHPDQVEFIKDYLDDAKRRDFTINTLYFDPIKKKTYDPTNGLKDLKAKLLRFVGDPKKRIDEDALRMLRGVRLATQLGFKLEKNSFAAIKTRAKYIQGISGERVKAELDKILLSKNYIEGIRLMDSIGLLKFILPELVTLKKVSQKSKLIHIEPNVFEHILMVMTAVDNKDLDLLYAAMFHDLGKTIKPVWVFRNGEWRNSFRGHDDLSVEIFQRFSTKYPFSKDSKRNILWLVKYHDKWTNFKDMKIEKKLELINHKNIDRLISLMQADDKGNLRKDILNDQVSNARKQMFVEAQKLRTMQRKTADLQIKLAKGDLIMKYSNLKPGKQLGDKIQDVKVQIVLGKIKNEKDLKNYLN